MLMHDFKKVRGYNPILFLRTAIESSKPAARVATRVTAIAECRNFLCLISWGHSTVAEPKNTRRDGITFSLPGLACFPPLTVSTSLGDPQTTRR